MLGGRNVSVLVLQNFCAIQILSIDSMHHDGDGKSLRSDEIYKF